LPGGGSDTTLPVVTVVGSAANLHLALNQFNARLEPTAAPPQPVGHNPSLNAIWM
jgi:hypothetical protein